MMAFFDTSTAKWLLLSACLVVGFHIGGTAGAVIGLIETPVAAEATVSAGQQVVELRN